MDNITHTLVGAGLGQAGAKRWTPLAMTALVVGANLPDVDAAAYAWGDTRALAFRRGWTHGVLAMVALPLLLTGALLLFDRWRTRSKPPRVRPWPLLAVATLGVWSHPLLDWMNTYGVRWLAPLSWRWYHGDAWFIADPWIWIILLGGVALARRFGPAAARAALVACVAYGAGMWAWSGVARRAAEAAAGADSPGTGEPRWVLASPVALNPLRRTVLIGDSALYRFGSFGPDRRFRASGELAKHPELRPAVEADPRGRLFLAWARYPYFRSAGSAVEVGDARYAGPGGGGWATVTVPAPGPASTPAPAAAPAGETVGRGGN